MATGEAEEQSTTEELDWTTRNFLAHKAVLDAATQMSMSAVRIATGYARPLLLFLAGWCTVLSLAVGYLLACVLELARVAHGAH